jgi:mannose-6-phosphate isomerase
MDTDMKLQSHSIEKPWGRDDVGAAFGVPAGGRIGEIWYDDGGGSPLPLLVKWLFTSEKLSVQVHPSDDEAHARGLPSGKEECWYIVHAQPGAVIGLGTKYALDAAQLRAASLDGSIEQLLDWKPVQAGDYFYIPAGTVHAIGAGIILVEVQQYADVTYRLYDYHRLDKGALRPLHLDDGVAVAVARPYTDTRCGNALDGQVLTSRQLANGPYFRLWLIRDAAAFAALPADARRWITPIKGEVYVDDIRANEIRSGVGDCLLIPAGSKVRIANGSVVLVAMEYIPE